MALLHVHRYGPPDGEPLLAIHGVTAHGRRFRRLAEEALPARRVLAVDLRGHGASDWDPPWSLDRHLADLGETLDHLGVERTDVIGHSFGGLLATSLLATSPHRVGRVVLLDPAMSLDPVLAREAAEETLDDESWASLEEGAEARAASQVAAATEAARVDAMISLVQGADGRFRRRFSRPAVITGWGEMARPLPELPRNREILLVTAGRAPFVNDRVRAALPDATEHVLDCGHVMLWEAFDDVSSLVQAFLAR